MTMAHTRFGRMLFPAFGILATLSWLMPNHYLPWTSFHNEFVAAVAAAFAVVAAVVSPSLHWPPVAWLPLLVAVVPMLQYATGQVHFLSDAVLASLYLVGFAMSIAAGATLRAHHAETFLTTIVASVIFGAIASVGLALCQLFQLNLGVLLVDLPPGGRPYANLAQPNHLATLMGLGAAAGLFAFEQRRIGAWTTTLLLSWLGLGLLMSQSKTGWLFVGVLGLGAWLAVRVGIRLRLAPTAFATGIAAFAVGVVAWPALNEALLLSQPQGVQERLQSGERILHWRTLGDALLRAPWTGYGWNQVALAQQAAVLDHPPSGETLEHSHNLLLDLVIWNGIPLGGLIMVVLVAWLWRRVRVCNSAAEWAGLIALAAIGVHALTEFPLDYAYFLLPLGMIMGALTEVKQPPMDSAGAQVWARIAFSAQGLMALALLFWIASEYGRIEQGMRELRFAQAGYGITLADVREPSVALLDGPREFQRYARTEATVGMAARDLDWMRRVSSRYPYAPSIFRYALAAGLNGQEQEASNALGRLCRMNPPQRCDEARGAWQVLQGRYPELVGITVPRDPRLASGLGGMLAR
jgi:O-antigen ligase